MKISGLILAAMVTASALAAVSCSEKNNSSQSPETPVATEPVTEPDKIEGVTLTWLSDFDINPAAGEKPSAALEIFRNFYGADIRYVRTTAREKFSALDNMLNSGDEVDMFPYSSEIFAGKGIENRFQPLDPYFEVLGAEEDMWQDMTGITDSLAYKGDHYIVPYSISDPVLVTYSRRIMKEEKLDDPWELYQQGKWDWDTMMSMMKDFTAAGAEKGEVRYGIGGEPGEALINSTGHGVVEWNGSVPVSKLDSPELARAEEFMQEIRGNGLYRNDMSMSYPADDSTLFFVMGAWSLGESNAQNPDDDLMIVPFPSPKGTAENYITCRLNARMLVKGSDKGEAVAAYIKSERIAATEAEYLSAARKNALVTELRAPGILRYSMTGEQYDAVQSCLDTKRVTPVYDCGFSMGSRMTGGTDISARSGVMEKLASSLLIGDPAYPDWNALKDSCKDIINEEIKARS